MRYSRAQVLLPPASRERNATNLIWISKAEEHRAVQTNEGTTVNGVPHTTSLQFPLLFFLIYAVKMKKLRRDHQVNLNKFTSPNISDTTYFSDAAKPTGVSSDTHSFSSCSHSWDLPFPDSSLYFPQLLTLDKKATRMYNTLHENLKGNAVENC